MLNHLRSQSELDRSKRQAPCPVHLLSPHPCPATTCARESCSARCSALLSRSPAATPSSTSRAALPPACSLLSSWAVWRSNSRLDTYRHRLEKQDGGNGRGAADVFRMVCQVTVGQCGVWAKVWAGRHAPLPFTSHLVPLPP